eukprot:9079695-Ditylum_brightwellii.AAC.1
MQRLKRCCDKDHDVATWSMPFSTNNTIRLAEIDCTKQCNINSLLHQRGPNRTGNKTVLINKSVLLDPVIPDLLQELMQKWFMKPLTSSYLKIGSVNEAKCGLLVKNGSSHMARSIDGAAVIG